MPFMNAATIFFTLEEFMVSAEFKMQQNVYVGCDVMDFHAKFFAAIYRV
jgi:hypothetical protein